MTVSHKFQRLRILVSTEGGYCSLCNPPKIWEEIMQLQLDLSPQQTHCSNNTQPNGVGGLRKKIMSCVCFHDIRSKLSRWEVHKINKYYFENQFQLYGSLNNSDSIFSLSCSDWSRTTTKRLNIFPSKVSLNVRFNYNFIFLLFCRGCLNSY